MKIEYKETGICGLSCRLCPNYHTEAKSRCPGCKSEYRMSAGCPFITCAIKKKGVELCVLCPDKKTCMLWKKHRAAGKKHDSFKCYQSLEKDIAFMEKNGVDAFTAQQKEKEKLLQKLLKNYNEGRSKSYYCIAVTVMDVEELEQIMKIAGKMSAKMDLKERAKLMHSLIGDTAKKKKYFLGLRK